MGLVSSSALIILSALNLFFCILAIVIGNKASKKLNEVGAREIELNNKEIKLNNLEQELLERSRINSITFNDVKTLGVEELKCDYVMENFYKEHFDNPEEVVKSSLSKKLAEFIFNREDLYSLESEELSGFDKTKYVMSIKVVTKHD